uniref:Uncharacterized protein n=1 Tax=Thermoplasma acidophilum TaxID=2303 RepID=Q0KKY3_THEAI|nr:hypothetical protein [Thermoplasma acidophilum]
MGLLERRKLKKIQEEARANAIQIDGSTAQDYLEYQEKTKKYRRKARRETIKALIPLSIATTTAGLFTNYMFSSSIGPKYSLPLTIGTIATELMLLAIIISKTYQPASDLFIVTGLTDPDNPKSAIYIEKWLIPKKLIENYHIDGSQYSVQTTEGMAYLCEDMRYDYNSGELYIKFGWPNLDRFAFLTKQETFHLMEKILNKLMTKIEIQEAYQEVSINLKTKERSNKMIHRIFRSLYNHDESESQQDIREMTEEMTGIDEEIKSIINPIKQEEKEEEEA